LRSGAPLSRDRPRRQVFVTVPGLQRTASRCAAPGTQVLVPASATRYMFASFIRIPPMRALFLVIDLALEIYIWLLIAAAILSWLVAFNVVNTRNQVVGMIGDFLLRITEPALRPIRNIMPDLGGIDISPVILILIIIFIRYVIALYILPNVY
jgi:YggT family protein